MKALGEFEIIERFFREIGCRADVRLGVGDDAAVLDVPAAEHVVAAVDTIVEGVHFPAELDAADIGWRALAVNLSDLAAMGAKPAWATLALSLPQGDPGWLARFAEGFAALAREYDVALVGGDTVRGPLVISVQVLGLVERDGWLARARAAPGDLVLVSGTPGDAAAGLELFRRGMPYTDSEQRLVERFTRPSPRIALGRWLRERANAAMDVSDGLLTDLAKLCAASDCAAEVELAALPLSEQLRAYAPQEQCERFALAGGDDYELVFTIPQAACDSLLAASDLPVACTVIGRVHAGRGVRCVRDGVLVPAPAGGYDHFAADAPS